MYLTKIKHDFNFVLENEIDEVLYGLEFKKTSTISSLPFLQSKIVFQTNQGRNTYVLWNNPFWKKRKTYIFVVENIVKFYWEEGTQSIKYTYLKEGKDDLVKYWLLHTFLPLYYVLEDIYDILHVGAVDFYGKALLFAAPSFGGKSTLTNYFVQQGHTLISDDRIGLVKAGVDYRAVPSYPYARKYRKLETLGKYVQNFAKTTLPIHTIYHLKQVGPEEEVCIKKLKGNEKFSVIEMSHDIKFSSLKQKKFFALNTLAQNITIYELQVPQNIERLEEVYCAILEKENV